MGGVADLPLSLKSDQVALDCGDIHIGNISDLTDGWRDTASPFGELPDNGEDLALPVG